MTMSVKEKARTYRELGKLLGASFPMDKSIAMLLGQHTRGPRHVFLKGIDAGFAQRLSFAESMRQHNRDITSEMELSLIDSGERSGRLAQACEHLAHYFEVWDKGIREARGCGAAWAARPRIRSRSTAF
jgi:type II secretory pathway component PulF